MSRRITMLAAKALSLFMSVAMLAGCGASSAEQAVRVIENPKFLQEAEVPAGSGSDAGKEDKKEEQKDAEKPVEQKAAEPAKPEEPKEKTPEFPPIAKAYEGWTQGENKSLSDETARLIERAASMQDYSHAPGADAEKVSEVDDNLLLLINKTHPLSKDYKASDLEVVTRFTAGVGTDETHMMRKDAAAALNELLDGAKADGYDIRLRTGFRSYSYQNTLYSNYVKNNGEAAANRFSAKPGESEHQTGLCCDVGVNGVSLTGFNDRKEAVWIADHAHEYGFILRYPKDKEDITGYMYESWHIRYVGKEAAAEIWQQGLCLEEYLGVTD